jgi:hypothetical protein
LVSPVERISQDAGDGQSTPAGIGTCQGIEEVSENSEPKDETVKLEEAASVQKSVEVELEKLAQELHQPSLARADGRFPEIGRASCRERVCQYV